jgi:hypothetical protein
MATVAQAAQVGAQVAQTGTQAVRQAGGTAVLGGAAALGGAAGLLLLGPVGVSSRARRALVVVVCGSALLLTLFAPCRLLPQLLAPRMQPPAAMRWEMWPAPRGDRLWRRCRL